MDGSLIDHSVSSERHYCRLRLYISSYPVKMGTVSVFRYAFFHATRKTFSNVKVILKEEWTGSFHNDSFNETKPDAVSSS